MCANKFKTSNPTIKEVQKNLSIQEHFNALVYFYTNFIAQPCAVYEKFSHYCLYYLI